MVHKQLEISLNAYADSGHNNFHGSRFAVSLGAVHFSYAFINVGQEE